MRKLLLAILAAWLLVLAASPQAQSGFWVLVNGALRTNKPVLFNSVGSTAAPSIAIGERNTGFYLNGSGTLQFTSAGAGAGALSGSSWTTPAQLFIGTGQDFSISRIAAGQYGITAVLQANLGTPANGTFCYCSDCTIANPCAGGGTGAFAKRLNATWICN